MAEREPTRRALLGRSRALDGLRGLALTWVVTYHYTGADGPIPGGWVGLDIFFVLSGFLITAMLLDERRLVGRVDLKKFYIRRALRLLPALYLMLAVWSGMLLLYNETTWFAATPGGDGSGDAVDTGRALRQVGIVLLYGVNWVYALGSGEAPLAHLWSLAVEEQFYAIWPITLLVLLRLGKKWLLGGALTLAAVSTFLPYLYWDSGTGANRIYFGTDTRAVGMLLGAAAALWWYQRASRREGGESVETWYGRERAWMGAAGICLVLVTVGNNPVKFLLGPALTAALAMQIVPYLVEQPRGQMSRMLSRDVLVWLGQRSYAIYLWHYLFATWLHPQSPWIHIPVGIGLSILAGHLSWILVEERALRYSAKHRPERAGSRREERTAEQQTFPEPKAVRGRLQGGLTEERRPH